MGSSQTWLEVRPSARQWPTGRNPGGSQGPEWSRQNTDLNSVNHLWRAETYSLTKCDAKDFEVPDVQLTRQIFSNASIHDMRLGKGSLRPLTAGCSHGMVGVPPLVLYFVHRSKAENKIDWCLWWSELKLFTVTETITFPCLIATVHKSCGFLFFFFFWSVSHVAWARPGIEMELGTPTVPDNTII